MTKGRLSPLNRKSYSPIPSTKTRKGASKTKFVGAVICLKTVKTQRIESAAWYVIVLALELKYERTSTNSPKLVELEPSYFEVPRLPYVRFFRAFLRSHIEGQIEQGQPSNLCRLSGYLRSVFSCNMSTDQQSNLPYATILHPRTLKP